MADLLDTSYVIKLLREGRLEEGHISVITLIEFLRGVPAGKREEVKRSLEEAFGVIGIDNDVVLAYCELYDKLKKAGKMLPDADLIIAATAKAKGLTLRTLDRDFERLRELGVRVAVGEEA